MLYLKTLIIVVQLLSAFGVIGLVLLQHGKGADMGAAFGSGASGSLFGATGSANFLSRTTAVLAAVFFISTLTLTYLGSYKPSLRRLAGRGGSDCARSLIRRLPLLVRHLLRHRLHRRVLALTFRNNFSPGSLFVR
jgi:protein translocase SecG subunit